MKKVFLVQSVDTDTFKKLAKSGIKTHYFDCSAKVITYYGCSTKETAVKHCRNNNQPYTKTRYFVNEVYLY